MIVNNKENPEFLNVFLQYSSVILNKSQNSVKEYNYDLSNFFRFMSNHLGYSSQEDIKSTDIRNLDNDFLKKITLEDIHSYLYYLKETYNSKPATLARKASTIRVFFSYITNNKDNDFDINPAQNLENPKLDRRQPKYLTLEESRELLKVSSSSAPNESDRNIDRDFAIITLFLNCGMRLSELVDINLKDIKFDDAKLTVIGKGNKERTIYLNKACMKALNNYLAVRPAKDRIKEKDQDALFISERLERVSRRTVQYVVEKELKKAGLDTTKYSTHKLRHTAATLMYQHGNVDIRALQELLGHKSISTTELYTHVANAQVRDAVERNPLSGEF